MYRNKLSRGAGADCSHAQFRMVCERPLPPSAALPLSSPLEGETRAKRARGSLTTISNMSQTGHELMDALQAFIKLLHRGCIRNADVIVGAERFAGSHSNVHLLQEPR